MELRKKTGKPRHTVPQQFRHMAIRSMPYEIRLRNYEREKDDLFDRMGKMTVSEIHAARQELVRKWMV